MRRTPLAAPLLLAAALIVSPSLGQEESSQGDQEKSGLRKLVKDGEVWVDTQRKLVVVGGEVVLREGPLEMFACPKGTKEHESIVAVNSRAQYVHAALLAIGAKPGGPVEFQPEYKPATGTPIDVWVLWKDEEGGEHKTRAQEWVRNVKTEKAMKYSWVFAGSGIWRDEATGETRYMADDGDFICVSNFPTAMLDLPVESPAANADLLYEAFTEKIPPRGTKVRVVLMPRPEKEANDAENAEAAQ